MQDESVQYRLEALPDAGKMSGGEIALMFAFSPIIIPAAIIYGIFRGVDDERDKLKKMISNASSQIKDFITKRSDSLKHSLSFFVDLVAGPYEP